MISIQHISYFISIAETKSINKTAELLYISQPALSTAIQKLEEEINTTLLIRSSRGVSLTPEGEMLYRYGLNLMKQLELIQNIGVTGGEQRLRISSFPLIGISFAFEKLWNQFDMDTVRIDYEECRVEKVINNVSNGVSEIGIIQYNSKQKREFLSKVRKNSLIYNEMYKSDWSVCVSKKHPLAKNNYVSFKQLKEYTLLSPRDDYFSNILNNSTMNGFPLGSFNRNFVCFTESSSHLLTATNMFMFSCMDDAECAKRKGLCVLGIESCSIKISVGWLSKKDVEVSDESKAFVQHLQDLATI